MKKTFLFLALVFVFSILTEAQDLKGYFEKDSFEINYALEEKIPKTIYSLELSICDLTSQIVFVYSGIVLPKDPNSYSLEGSFFRMKQTGEVLIPLENFKRYFIHLEKLNKIFLENYFLEMGKDQRFLEIISGTWKNYELKPPKKPKVYDKINY